MYAWNNIFKVILCDEFQKVVLSKNQKKEATGKNAQIYSERKEVKELDQKPVNVDENLK